VLCDFSEIIQLYLEMMYFILDENRWIPRFRQKSKKKGAEAPFKIKY